MGSNAAIVTVMSENPAAETSDVQFGETRDGVKQLRRHWRADSPRAAMLIVHGIGEHSGRYNHVGSYLASKGIDVEAFDNRGFGQSGGKRAHVDDFQLFVDDIEDRLAERSALGVPVVLMGHSLGGLMAATYLVSNRPQPDLAVLSSPALGAEVPRWQRVAAPVLGRLTPKLFIASKPEGGILSRDPAVDDAYQSDPLVVFGATARFGQQTFLTMAATSTALDKITVPTYVFHGDADELVPQAVSLPLQGRANVTYRSWPGLRHECLNEPEQDKVLAELVEWLNTQVAADDS